VLSILDSLSDRNNLYLITDTPPSSVPLSHLLDHVSCSSATATATTAALVQEKHIVLFAAAILSVLKFCHARSIVHRGLHPDSLLIDRHGALKVADWGFAKVVKDRTYTLCGHVEYLSPEAICGETGYGRGVDYWALGVLIFEMLVGRSAFSPSPESLPAQQYGGSASASSSAAAAAASSSHDTATIDNILSADPLFPAAFPHPAKSIIQGLCAKSVSQRLGCTKGGRGIEDIASHIWFRQNGGVDWTRVDQGEALPCSPPLPPLPEEIFQGLSSSPLSLDEADTAAGPITLETVKSGPLYSGYFCRDWSDFKPSVAPAPASAALVSPLARVDSLLKQSCLSPKTVISMPTHRRESSLASSSSVTPQPPSPAAQLAALSSAAPISGSTEKLTSLASLSSSWQSSQLVS
jgi:serine/threonine protein kinase